MTTYRTIAVAVALAACPSVRAAASPSALAADCPAGSSVGDTCEAPKSRDLSAAADLSVGGSFLDGIADIFTSKREGETCLPQDPKADQAARKEQLAERQKDYRWSTSGIPVGTPYLEGFPPLADLPTAPWIFQLVGSVLKIAVGTIRGSVGASEIIEAISDPERAKTFVARVREIIGDSSTGERPVDIEDYEELHAFPVKTPNSVHDWEDDDAFARLRLQGANCVVIEKCSQKTRDKLKALDFNPEYKDLKNKVDSLMKAGKLFVVDHELLAGMPSTPVDGLPRYLAPSVALFEAVDDDILPLRVIGIQLSQGEEETPIFTPEDGMNWRIAKACFESADFIIHEIVSHLGNTHIVLEGPVVAMNRQLPKEHPIYDLLQPHLEGTAFINWAAQALLIEPGGSVDRLQANDIKDSWDLVLAQTLERISKDFSPEADFKARQMTTKEFPGRYPYRDYGMRYWEATHTWVKEYLDLYYKTDKDVVADYELQAFVKEMKDIAQMKWLNDFDKSKDKKALITKVLASLIYSASTLHAAVNFPQKSSMSFVPSCPSSMFVAPPTDKKERTFKEYLAYLPPMEIATNHVTVLTLLGSVYHTKLGDYNANQFDDSRVKGPLSKFQAAIEAIEIDMVDGNAYVVSEWRKRGKDKKDAANFSYTTLLPDNIPQSTNI